MRPEAQLNFILQVSVETLREARHQWDCRAVEELFLAEGPLSGDPRESLWLMRHLLVEEASLGPLERKKPASYVQRLKAIAPEAFTPEDEADLLRDLAALPPEKPYLSNYRLVRCLGQGGMGTVLLVEREGLFRQGPFALKVIGRAGDALTEALTRFVREGELTDHLRRLPGVVSILDSGTDRGVAFLVMDYVPGLPLRSLLRSRGRLPAEEAAKLVERLARIVARVHQAEVVHRDLKPDNVMLSDTGELHLIDFGVAARLEQSSDREPATLSQPMTYAEAERLTKAGQFLGTILYAAPERFPPSTASNGAVSEVFSLGAILYEMLTGTWGRPEWEAAHRGQLDRRPLREAGVPESLEAICLAALAADPARRIATPQELAEELNRYLQGRTPRVLRGALVRPELVGAATAGLVGTTLGLAHVSGGIDVVQVDAGQILPGLLLAWLLALNSLPGRRIVSQRGVGSTLCWVVLALLSGGLLGLILGEFGPDAPNRSRVGFGIMLGLVLGLLPVTWRQTGLACGLAILAMIGFSALPSWGLTPPPHLEPWLLFLAGAGLVGCVVGWTSATPRTAFSRRAAQVGLVAVLLLGFGRWWWLYADLEWMTYGPVEMTALAIAPEQSLVVIADDRKRLLLGDGRRPPREIIAQLSAKILGVAISQDGRWLAATADDGLNEVLWAQDRERGTTLERKASLVNPYDYGNPGRRVRAPADQVAFVPGQATLALGGSGVSLVRLGDEFESLNVWIPTRGSRFALTPGGDRVATAGPGWDLSLHGLNVWRLAGAENPGHLVHDINVGELQIDRLAYLPDGEHLVIGDSRGGLRLWHLPTEKEVACLQAQGPKIADLSLSPDGQRLAVGYQIDIEPVYSDSDGPDSGYPTLLKAGSRSGEVDVWDLGSLRCVRTISVGEGPAILGFVGERRLLIAGRDRSLRLWRVP